MKRKLRLGSEDLIPLLLGGFAGAVWMLLIDANVAAADDCLRYVQKVKNFVSIPKDLLEDCMRTGSVQAIITMILGGMGGGLIATAVGKGLKDANKNDKDAPGPDSPEYQEGTEGPKKDNPWDPTEDEKKKKWREDKVVWDPRELGWRRPRPDEFPPADEGPARKGPSKEEIRNKWEKEKLVWDPEKNIWRKKGMDESPPPDYPPEEPPYAKGNPRANTPPECLDQYDAYVRSQRRMLELEPEIEKTALDFRLAQDWLQLKLGIFTAQFAVDMTDFMQFGTAMVRAAGPISQAIGRAGSIGGAMRAAGRRAASLAKAVVGLLQELAALGLKAAKLRTAAGVLKESARILTKYADDLAEAVLALDKKVASNRSLLAIAENLEPLQTKRASIVSNLVDAQKRLAAAEKIWERKYQLQRWAEGERASIPAEQARLAMSAQRELDAVNEEIRNLQSKIAQSPEVANAQKRTGRATTSRAKIDARIRELEAEVKQLSGKLDAIKKKVADGKAQLDQAAKLEREIGELEGFKADVDNQRAKVQRAKQELKDFESGPEMGQYKAERQRLRGELEAATEARERAQMRLEKAGKAEIEFGADLAEELRLLGIEEAVNDVDLLAPAKAREMKERYRAIDEEVTNAKTDLANAKTEVTNARIRAEEGIKELDAREAALVERHTTLKADLASEEIELTALEKRLTTAANINYVSQYDGKVAALRDDARALAQEGQAALDRDPVSQQVLQQLLDDAQQELPIRRSELPAADREFDDATNIENNVRTQLEGTERSALDARKVQAEAKLKKANRSWQEVAAEKDPSQFQEWKLTVEGTDPFNDGPAELRPLQQEVLDGRKAEADVEKEIGAQRDKAEDLKKAIADDDSALNEKRTEAGAARDKSRTAESEAADADKAAADAEADYAAKDADVKNAKAQQQEADIEAAKEAADTPADPNLDPGSRGASGAIDDLTKWSADKSAAVKPGWAKGTEEVMRTIAGAFGERWARLFNGQSPDEVAEGLKKSRDKVIRLKEELESKKAEYDALRIAIQTQKPALDACVQQYTYWKGPTAEE